MTPIILGKNIRKARNRKCWVQQQLADKVKCNVGHISDIERGQRSPSIWLLASMCKALDTTMDKLFSEK